MYSNVQMFFQLIPKLELHKCKSGECLFIFDATNDLDNDNSINLIISKQIFCSKLTMQLSDLVFISRPFHGL